MRNLIGRDAALVTQPVAVFDNCPWIDQLDDAVWRHTALNQKVDCSPIAANQSAVLVRWVVRLGIWIDVVWKVCQRYVLATLLHLNALA